LAQDVVSVPNAGEYVQALTTYRLTSLFCSFLIDELPLDVPFFGCIQYMMLGCGIEHCAGIYKGLPPTVRNVDSNPSSIFQIRNGL
jgi:hypothetical protein